MIKYLWRAKQPYNVSVASETAALAALENASYMQGIRDTLVQERERLRAALQDIPLLTPYPSSANFVLCKVPFSCLGLWFWLPLQTLSCF